MIPPNNVTPRSEEKDEKETRNSFVRKTNLPHITVN